MDRLASRSIGYLRILAMINRLTGRIDPVSMFDVQGPRIQGRSNGAALEAYMRFQ